MEGKEITSNLTAAVEKVVDSLESNVSIERFLPACEQLPVPMGFLGGSRIQTCPKPGLGQGGAVLMPVMHPTPGDAKTWLGLGKQGQEEGGVQAQQGGVCKAKQGKAREELIKQGSGGMARNGARGSHTAPTASLQPLGSSDAFLEQGKGLVERQKLLSASLLHRQNMEKKNHCKLSLLPSVEGERKCSFDLFSFLPFFLSLLPFF